MVTISRSRFRFRAHSGQFIGRVVMTNEAGRGVYTNGPRGSFQAVMHVSPRKTPTFKSKRHLAQWVRRHFPEPG